MPVLSRKEVTETVVSLLLRSPLETEEGQMALVLKEGAGSSQLPEATVHGVNAIRRGLIGRVACAVDPCTAVSLFYNDTPEGNSQNPVVVCFNFYFLLRRVKAGMKIWG